MRLSSLSGQQLMQEAAGKSDRDWRGKVEGTESMTIYK
jgi:hypothetical protein